jgi:hypothetical protein
VTLPSIPARRGDNIPRLTCLCGEQISLSPIPNSYGFKVHSEWMMEGLIERIIDLFEQELTLVQFKRWLYDLVYLTPPRPLQVYECPVCVRLAVFRLASDEKVAMWYLPEPPAGAQPVRLRELASSDDDGQEPRNG